MRGRVPERLPPSRADGTFQRFNLRHPVVLCQLPLTLIVLVIAVAAPVLRPGLLQNATFEGAVFLHLLLLALCVLIPWPKLPRGAILLIPVLDFPAIALYRYGALESQPSLGVLTFFPVLWLAASRLTPWISVPVGFAGSSLVVLLPLAVDGTSSTVVDFTTALLLPVVMVTLALTVHLAKMQLRLNDHELRQKEQELKELLKASNKRENLLSTILDTVDLGLIAVNADGKHTLTNHQQDLFHRLACISGGSVTEEEGQLLFAPDRTTPLAQEQRPIRRALAGETFADQLVWIGTGDDQRAVSTAARPIRNDDGGLAGAVIVCSDVTRLVDAVAAKDAFISNVSHDFHAPLTSVLGYLELVLEDEHPLPDYLQAYLEVATRNAERVLDLVADLLATAGDNVRVHPKPVDLAGLVEMGIRSHRLRAQENNIVFEADVPAPLWSLLDPLRISQVLDNLFSNAIKYSPDGGVVTISACETAASLELQVRDTGIGMPPQETSKIFSRFYRTPAARNGDINGLGLGLAITKAIVEAHGGTISCASSLGVGTVFTVTLPSSGGAGVPMERAHPALHVRHPTEEPDPTAPERAQQPSEKYEQRAQQPAEEHA